MDFDCVAKNSKFIFDLDLPLMSLRPLPEVPLMRQTVNAPISFRVAECSENYAQTKANSLIVSVCVASN